MNFEAKADNIDVVIADKSPLVLSGLTQLFDKDDRFGLLATAPDGERFMEAVVRLNFDVGIVGWDMPYMEGRAVLQAVRQLEQDPPPRIIIYTGNPSPEIPRMVMHLGGAGFCSKREPPERLMETVLSVADGRMVFPFMDLSDSSIDPLGDLTGREQELLSSLAQGLTNAQISGELGISLNTVKFHLKNLYGKLHVRNRAQAVARYLRVGRGY